MKMSSGEKMIFATTYTYMLKSCRNCTVEDCINSAAAAVVLFRQANTDSKLTDAAHDMCINMGSDKKEEDC